MSISVELTYDMSKALGDRRIAVEPVATVKELLQAVRGRFASQADDFERLTRVTSIAVNGVLISHRKGLKSRLADGDRVAFLKAAAGG
jgi:molybdopterin converting factor small subunit